MTNKEIKTIDDYIGAQREAVQPILEKIRETIHKTIPEATEKISWRMPTFWNGQNIIHFAAFKNHIGIYPGPEVISRLGDRLAEYKTSKGAIQLPTNKPIDYNLIEDIVKLRIQIYNCQEEEK